MGQATRTTRLEIDLGKRRQAGTNQSKRTYLQATMALLDRARAFYEAGQARMQMSRHVKVVGRSLVQGGTFQPACARGQHLVR